MNKLINLKTVFVICFTALCFFSVNVIFENTASAQNIFKGKGAFSQKKSHKEKENKKLQASQPADFVWKYTYGRGVGTATFLACRKGRDKVGGLCYDKCKSGYSVNKNNKLRCKPPGEASYGRGAGKIPHAIHGCRSREKQNGLCYDRCREGYRGEGPVCHRRAQGYDRQPFPLKSTCEQSKEMHQGLCYKHCRPGTKGIGPVCWAKKTKGYVDCGLGFATGFKVPFAKKGVSPKTNCAIITAGQVLAAADFAAYLCTLGGYPACGVVGQMDKIKIAQEYVGMEDEVLTYGQLTFNKMLPYAKRIAKMISKDPDALTAAANQRRLIEEAGNLEELWNALSAFQKISLAKTSGSAASKSYNIFSKMTYSGDLNTQAGQLAIVRDAAALSSAFIVIAQLTGQLPPQSLELDGALSAFGILSSYAYPISTKM